MTTKDGGQAFPVSAGSYCNSSDEVWPPTEGMTLRDYFAGQVLAGVYASGSHRDVAAAIQDEGVRLSASELAAFTVVRIAAMVYEVADAMLAEREKTGA